MGHPIGGVLLTLGQNMKKVHFEILIIVAGILIVFYFYKKTKAKPSTGIGAALGTLYDDVASGMGDTGTIHTGAGSDLNEEDIPPDYYDDL